MADSAARQTDASEPAGRRDRAPLAKRVLIIGLDGATFDVLGPMMDAGRMPRLKEFIDGGTSGVLRSTIPPITPAAWTTFMTGKGPGRHGIIDFERYDVRTNQLSFNSTQCLDRTRTIWQILSDKGFRVGSVNVPMTYPPMPVNGFMISGFETPSINTDFAYPKELKRRVLDEFPQYSFKTKWRRKTFGGDALFTENLRYIKQSFHQGARLTRFCGDEYGWDLLMVVFKLVDNLQHKTWKYIDERTRGASFERARLTASCFNDLDEALGELFEYAHRYDAHVVIMSDHGHGSLEGKVHPNLLLKNWGYLVLRGGGARARTRAAHILHRWFKTEGRFAGGNLGLEHDLAVDFSRTRAAVMHAGMAAFLYINLKGRQQTGIVEPGDYEALRDELRERLLAERCTTPDGKTIPVFTEVHKPEELYGCKREDSEWLPDLLLTPAEALAVVRKIRGSSPVSWLPQHRMEGTHRVNGIFASRGPGIAAGKTISSDLVHITPTVLAMMGLNVPDDMEGRVIEDLFDPPIEIGTESAPEAIAGASDQAAYSAEDQELLTQRLRDLGYLE
ncbi:MAG TPA: alkaline phosphatase family protein [Phycisphaerae bacterium]|nr:alkaline phosphatase family protein [Phycisphaerae bacterium]